MGVVQKVQKTGLSSPIKRIKTEVFKTVVDA